MEVQETFKANYLDKLEWDYERVMIDNNTPGLTFLNKLSVIVNKYFIHLMPWTPNVME